MAGLNPAMMDDVISQMPDAMLAQMLQDPNAQIPPFMVLAEMKRRQQMRTAAKAGPTPSTPTVKDDVMGSAPPGIAGMAGMK